MAALLRLTGVIQDDWRFPHRHRNLCHPNMINAVICKLAIITVRLQANVEVLAGASVTFTFTPTPRLLLVLGAGVRGIQTR